MRRGREGRGGVNADQDINCALMTMLSLEEGEKKGGVGGGGRREGKQ